MTTNRARAAEIIYRTLNPKYGDFSHHEETADALVAAGLLAPEPATPRTMAEIEWNDVEHHLAEALFGDTRKVVMLARDTDEEGDWSEWVHCRMEDGSTDLIEKEYLTPTGRKYRLEPEDGTPTSPTEDKPTPEQQALARDIFGSFPSHDPEHKHVHWAKHTPESAAPRPEDVPVGEPWQVEIDGQTAIGYRNDPEDGLCWVAVCRDDSGLHWMYDEDVTLISRLVPEDAEQDDKQEFNPAYTYRDKDGDVWEYQTRTMRWRCYPEIGVSFEVTGYPPTERVPYTRVEKENHDH